MREREEHGEAALHRVVEGVDDADLRELAIAAGLRPIVISGTRQRGRFALSAKLYMLFTISGPITSS